MIIQVICSGPVETNAIFLGCEKTFQAAVVDPSFGSAPALLDLAETHKMKLGKILLTHSHWDHFADANELQKMTGALLYVHPMDAENLKKPGSDGVQMPIPIDPALPDRFVQEGDLVRVGEIVLRVIHTPGHSPGGVCYFIEEGPLLISGDTLFRRSIGNLKLATSNPALMWPSLQRLEKLPPKTRVFPGHGPETTLEAEDWLPRAKQLFSIYT